MPFGRFASILIVVVPLLTLEDGLDISGFISYFTTFSFLPISKLFFSLFDSSKLSIDKICYAPNIRRLFP